MTDQPKYFMIFTVAQNSTLSVHLSESEELFLLYMLLKEKEKLPCTVDHLCEAEGVVPMKIAILRLKPFSKSIEALQRRYCILNDR